MKGAAITLWLVVLAACGGDDEAGGFGTCEVSGSPFGHDGTGGFRGTGKLPSDLRDGLSLQLLLEFPEGFKTGVLSQNLFEFQKTCGDSFPFEVTKVEPGTYTVWVEARDPDMADAVDDSDIVYTADADKQVTVEDKVIDVNLDFQ